jgi:hypothetical protein
MEGKPRQGRQKEAEGPKMSIAAPKRRYLQSWRFRTMATPANSEGINVMGGLCLHWFVGMVIGVGGGVGGVTSSSQAGVSSSS